MRHLATLVSFVRHCISGRWECVGYERYPESLDLHHSTISLSSLYSRNIFEQSISDERGIGIHAYLICICATALVDLVFVHVHTAGG